MLRKQYKLCFRCLGDSHLGQYCNRTRVCGINGCKEVHYQLLHRDKIDKAQTVLLSSQDKVIEPKKKEEYRLISSKEQVAANKASNEVESSDEVQKADPSQLSLKAKLCCYIRINVRLSTGII